MPSRLFVLPAALLISFIALASQDVHAAYSYNEITLGQIPGLDDNDYYGLEFLNANTLLVGSSDSIYAVAVVRDENSHVIGFTGTPIVWASAPNIAKSGLTFGPGGVLFYTAESGDNSMIVGQIKPGSTSPDKMQTLTTGYDAGFLNDIAFNSNDASKAQFAVRYPPTAGNFYEATLTPDGLGTYDISAPTYTQFIGSITSLTIAPPSHPLLPPAAAVFGGTADASYAALDVNGHPTGGFDLFFTNPHSVWGSTFDPVTKDFLSTSPGAPDTIYNLQLLPEPGMVGFIAITTVGVMRRRRRFRERNQMAGASFSSSPVHPVVDR